MARVTVEDCVQYVPNRFDLVILAAKRARQLAAGDEPFLSVDNDKFTVLALREIGENKVDLDALLLAEDVCDREVVEEEEYSITELDARAMMEEDMSVAGVDEEDLEEADGFGPEGDLDDLIDVTEE